MTAHRSPPARRFSHRLVWAAWTVPALLSTFETVMFMRIGGRPIELWRAFASEAPGWYVWALLTPMIAALAERFPLARPIRVRNVAVHVAGWLFVALSAAGAWAALSLWLRGYRGGYLTGVRLWFLSGLPFTVLGYAAVVGVCYMLANRELARERERQATELARQLSEAQLAALRAQLQPHFLFNSLNAIMTLVRDAEGPRAVQALSTLSDILRAVLRFGAADEIALTSEVAFTRDYLSLERMRFPDRLGVTFDIPPSLLDAAVPTFVLQPFVENAIKHGLMDSRAGIAITIAAREAQGALELSVTDDGAGVAAASNAPLTNGHGVGIANARSRLVGLYGEGASLHVGRANGAGGTLVRIRLPLRRAAAT